MPKSDTQLRQLTSPPVTWLSDGILRASLLLRHEAMRTGRTDEAARLLIQEKVSAQRIFSEFPKIRDPDRTLLDASSDDYLRCLLAKSLTEVYRKVTPKYRNEAARKQFFKRMASLSEWIHLSSATGLRKSVFNVDSDDEATIWVANEFEKFLDRKVDLSNEYHGKLNAARNEFSSSMKQLETLVGVSWTESERYRSGLRMTSVFGPAVTEDENTWAWGSQWDSNTGTLNINPPILFNDVIRRGVVSRDAAILLSPRNMDALPRDLCEQSEYLAYRLFERKNDREFWGEVRHGIRKKTRFKAHELIDFYQFYEMMVGGDNLFRELWLRLRELGDAKIVRSDYLTIFNSLASRPTSPKFDDQELKLLNLLCKRPDLGAGDAARALGVSIPTAMKSIRSLTTKAGLSFTVLVDMQKIGLTEFLIPMRTSREVDVLKVLSRFPYCRQVFRVYGSFDLFTVLDIPSEHEGFTAELMRRMVERGLVSDFKAMRLRRDLHSVSFDHYDPKRGGWDIHWDSWGVGLRDDLAKANVGSSLQTQARMKIDRLDLNILSSLQMNCRTPFSAIARTHGVSGAYVGRRVARMASEGLFRYAIWPLKIGAEDWGLLSLSTSDATANTLASSISKLPAWRGGLVGGDIDGILAIVWCPNGELKQFFKAIDDRLVRTGLARAECLNSIGEWLVARWLPVDPDDPWKVFTDDGEWLFDEQRYLSTIT